MENIVVLGGGFAGVRVVLELIKKVDFKKQKVILIDKNPYHLFTPSLYEVATMEEPQRNVAIPYQELFGSKVTIIQKTINLIDTKAQEVELDDKTRVHYNQLAITLGSQTSYFNIPGLEKFSIPLKSLADAVNIQSKISSLVKGLGRPLKIIVGGGGFSGVELAAELANLKSRLHKIYQVSAECLEICVIEGAGSLVKELDSKISQAALERLTKNKVQVCLNALIKEVRQSSLITADGTVHEFDLLIWTGGVAANVILQKSGFEVNKRGQAKVDQNLKVVGFENIWAGGDLAEYTDLKTKKFAPGVAEVAEEQGKIIGQNIIRQINNQPLLNYQLVHSGYVVPLKGKFAIADLVFLQLSGFLGWVIQQLIFLRYMLGILPLNKAFIKWNKFEVDLKQD